MVPVLLLEPPLSMIVDVILGLALIVILNIVLAMARNEAPLRTVLEHVGIAAAVVMMTYLIGTFIALLL
jgi:VIT1/CCC1 family predicted Fe2+/Mn2+ transporter